MNTKHTPGPWDLNETQRGTYIYQGGTENCIAEIYADVNEDQAANARLIAAAPELLEALLALLPGAEAMGWSTEKARVAINKATQG